MEYPTTELIVKRSFLNWFEAHPLISNFEGATAEDYNKMLGQGEGERIEEFKITFNSDGNIAETKEELTSFLSAFDKLLKEKKVSHIHRDNLLYISYGYENVSDYKEYNDRALYNELKIYADAIRRLYKITKQYLKEKVNGKLYRLLLDESTMELLFIKEELLKEFGSKKRLEFMPEAKEDDDIITFHVIRFDLRPDWKPGEQMHEINIYLPKDLSVGLFSNMNPASKASKLEMSIPEHLTYEILSYTISNMLKLHKLHDTEFYNSLKDDKPAARKNAKKKPAKHFRWKLVGQIVSAYLLDNNIIIPETQRAAFCQKYLSLFKMFDVENMSDAPDDLEHLSLFYSRSGFDREAVRDVLRVRNKLGK